MPASRGGIALGLVEEPAQVADHAVRAVRLARLAGVAAVQDQPVMRVLAVLVGHHLEQPRLDRAHVLAARQARAVRHAEDVGCPRQWSARRTRSEEHTSELQSLMRISYAVFCLKKKKK